MSPHSEREPRHQRHSPLACFICRKRKVKCGREWPHCDICKETSQQCTYPSKAMRPGPKIGSTHATSQKRQCKASGFVHRFCSSLTNSSVERTSREKSPAQQRHIRIQLQEPGVNTAPGSPNSGSPASPAQSLPSQSPQQANMRSLSFAIHPCFDRCSPDRTEAVQESDITDCRYVDALMVSCNCLGLTLLQLNQL